ncbi:MAG TPA: methyltransferase domain-containing protein [Pyrinomonadaceae bacterium]|nr:methyltransferase domain-containing protein [Pyrinomonadaceae bacterium]
MKYLKLKLLLLTCALLAASCTAPQTAQENKANGNAANAAPTTSPTAAAEATPPKLDVPYVPTHEKVVDEMLAMAEVKGSDVLYDLGSGDGRIPITAAQRFGTRGVGIDLNPQRIKEANENAQKAGVTDKVKFIQGDIFKEDFSEATVVTLYLLPEVNLKLRPQILNMKPGTRVVSHNYDMGDWKPEKSKEIETPDGTTHYVYFWRVPEKKPDLK